MDFTREPIIETIITPKEGCKLVIRNSKNAGQEEYFVDAVEIVAFGNVHFFRSLERPKAFLAPVTDYEVLEVREARMVLKNAALERSIKIGGGKENSLKAAKEPEKGEQAQEADIQKREEAETMAPAAEGRIDKKRERRRNFRKRRGREDASEEAEIDPPVVEQEAPPAAITELPTQMEPILPPPSTYSSLLQPPPALISETIKRYRKNDLFKDAFFLTEEELYKPHDKVEELLNEEDELSTFQEQEEEGEEEVRIPILESPEFVGGEGHLPFQSSIETEQTTFHYLNDTSRDHLFENNVHHSEFEPVLPLFEEEERLEKDEEQT